MDEVTDRPVAIQVGGERFACRLSTLKRFPDALLWKAYTFNDRHFDLVFWDRNPRVFECLMEFYRTSRLALPPDLNIAIIREELAFWGFDLDLPERPSWPVLPSYFLRPGTRGPSSIPYPLGLALRESSSGCHLVLLMLVWSAIGRCTSVWEAAQRGHRSIAIYWKTRAPGIDSSVVRSHIKHLRHLAELDGCKVELCPEVTANNLASEVRSHDVYTHGHLHSSEQPVHVAEWRFPVRHYKDGHDLVIQSTSPDTLKFSFDVDGFRVWLHVLGDKLWWYINPLQDGEEQLSDGMDVRTLPASQGFLLEVSFLLGKTLLAGFMLPSTYYRTSTLRADMFLAQTFVDADESEDGWYRAPRRGQWKTESCPFELGNLATPSEDAELVLLIERKDNAALVCHPVNNIVPFSASISFAPCAYDKIKISW